MVGTLVVDRRLTSLFEMWLDWPDEAGHDHAGEERASRRSSTRCVPERLILITDRGVPVARLEPATTAADPDDEAAGLARLERSGRSSVVAAVTPARWILEREPTPGPPMERAGQRLRPRGAGVWLVRFWRTSALVPIPAPGADRRRPLAKRSTTTLISSFGGDRPSNVRRPSRVPNGTRGSTRQHRQMRWRDSGCSKAAGREIDPTIQLTPRAPERMVRVHPVRARPTPCSWPQPLVGRGGAAGRAAVPYARRSPGGRR